MADENENDIQEAYAPEELAAHPQAEFIEDDYEPCFDRASTTRRVLGHVTDEDHVNRGPRNTVERLAKELSEDPYTPRIREAHGGYTDADGKTVEAYDPASDVTEHVEKLVSAGLLERRDDDTLAVTRAGHVELVN
jgi:hypothetical protein